jgi:uncharacterized protein (TIGR03067 family)
VSIFSANVVIRTAPALVLVGLVALVPPVRAGLERVPEGTWAVAQATLNGEYRAESKILNSTWTFRGDELVVQQAGGARLRWALTFDPAAEPPAFRATPPDAPGERPVWMIVSRRNDELRLAFYDGLDQRPEDFGPRRKLVVLTLVPAPPATPAADPCEILRGAGADRLLGRHPHRWRHRGTRRAGWLSFVSLHAGSPPRIRARRDRRLDICASRHSPLLWDAPCAPGGARDARVYGLARADCHNPVK